MLQVHPVMALSNVGDLANSFVPSGKPSMCVLVRIVLNAVECPPFSESACAHVVLLSSTFHGACARSHQHERAADQRVRLTLSQVCSRFGVGERPAAFVV